MNALEVLIDGKRIGVYVPPKDCSFAAMVGNVPGKFMRAHIMTGTDTESWQWQLPDIKPGQIIAFRQINAAASAGIPPQFVRRHSAREIARTKRAAARLHAKAKQEMTARKQTRPAT